MEKIKWESYGCGDFKSFIAKVGCIRLRCYPTTRNEWTSIVSFKELSGIFRYGPFRKSLIKAKEDAIRLAYEILLDYQAGLNMELKNFE